MTWSSLVPRLTGRGRISPEPDASSDRPLRVLYQALILREAGKDHINNRTPNASSLESLETRSQLPGDLAYCALRDLAQPASATRLSRSCSERPPTQLRSPAPPAAGPATPSVREHADHERLCRTPNRWHLDPQRPLRRLPPAPIPFWEPYASASARTAPSQERGHLLLNRPLRRQPAPSRLILASGSIGSGRTRPSRPARPRRCGRRRPRYGRDSKVKALGFPVHC